MAKEEITGVQKAAILLIALGPEKSSNVFKHLKEDEIEQLTLEIANTRSVSPATKDAVLDEFYEVCLAQQYIAEGGITYAKELLEKALGEERARDVIGKLTASLQVRPFEFVRKTDASQLLNLYRMSILRQLHSYCHICLQDRQLLLYLHLLLTSRLMLQNVLHRWTELHLM